MKRRIISGLSRCVSSRIFTARSRPRSASRPLSTAPIPPRAISPKSCNRAERAAGSGISAEDGRMTGPGSDAESASRSRTGGILPKASPNAAKTLDGAGPNRMVKSSSSDPLPASPALSRHAGQRPDGASAGRFWPQTRQFSRSLITQPPQSVPRSHYPLMTDESKKVTTILQLAVESRQRPQKVGDLNVDICRIGDSPTDFFTKELPITTTEAVSGDLNGTLA